MDGVRVFKWQELGVSSHDEAVPLVLEDLRKTLQGMVKSIFGEVEMMWVEVRTCLTQPRDPRT